MEPHRQPQSQPAQQPHQGENQCHNQHQSHQPLHPLQSRSPCRPSSRPSYPQLYNLVASVPTHVSLRTTNSTPVSSPRLFSPIITRSNMSLPASEDNTPVNPSSSMPFLHPLQNHKVRETHKANVDHDHATGRKLINHYEIIEELGRGMHGKVKLARNLETNENVAIKIIPRFSKKRRLGKVTAMSTQDKSKKEIAILKKIRHPNIVALLEVIDDPELKKIYMILEHVELGEIVWRKKGLPHICSYERHRSEREMEQNEDPSQEEKKHEQNMERRQAVKETKRAKMFETLNAVVDYWSLEFNSVDDDGPESRQRSPTKDSGELLSKTVKSNPSSFAPSRAPSRTPSRAPSRSASVKSASRTGTPLRNASQQDFAVAANEDDLETPTARPSAPDSTGLALASVVPRPSSPPPEPVARTRSRSPSMADSIISHMSSNAEFAIHDAFSDDYSYVPCFTIDQARSTFRETVLGLEYLHYQGIVHRDIKPANLLSTRDHHVKISDFGVSYFGRPIRDGEPDETISESEARDFDNDLELAKTVGTPAFFAPELCYTDASEGTQPRITEQIDVWSLGVTLYCLVFARIPFLGEDEWQMFKKIAKETVYIPTRRLRPVDPSTKPEQASLYSRRNNEPYRDDDKLVYEDVDADLRDLLEKMLTKNPDKRIRLRDVKRHKFVTAGISNVVSWLDGTDPSCTMAGRKIQVDEREVAHAVVPLTLLERARSGARSVVKKIGKAINSRNESASSRKRATSSVASSAGDSPVVGHARDTRRRSLRPDDYFVGPAANEHPLTLSVSASPLNRPSAQPTGPVVPQASLVGGPSTCSAFDVDSNFNSRDQHVDGSTYTASPQKTVLGHAHTRSISTNTWLSLTFPSKVRRFEAQTVPTTPVLSADVTASRKSREMKLDAARSSRARSVDRALFSSEDKRAEASVALSTAQAPGNVSLPSGTRCTTDLVSSMELVAGSFPACDPPSAASCALADAYQHIAAKVEPGLLNENQLDVSPLLKSMGPLRLLDDLPDAKSPPQRISNSTIPESATRASEPDFRRQICEHEARLSRQQLFETVTDSDTITGLDSAFVQSPSSQDNHALDLDLRASFLRDQYEDGMATALSSSTESRGAMTTPLTSPSEAGSTCVTHGLPGKLGPEAISAFQSDPSLPALLSGASSVSADLEGEFLGVPGIPPESSTLDIIDTSDSLTPPAIKKEPVSGFPLGLLEEEAQPIPLDEVLAITTTSGSVPKLATRRFSYRSHKSRSDGDASDSESDDEGLTMAKHKRKASGKQAATASLSPAECHGMNSTSIPPTVRRRDTNMSIASTETVKRIYAESD